MTPEERRRLERNLESAKETKRRIQNQMETNAAEYKEHFSQKTQLNSHKKNLEARLEDVKQIISTLNGSVTSHINDANNAAVSASEKYTGAIICSEITNSSIHEAYKTLGVQNESHSCDTYERCQAEVRRLENAIIQIQQAIRETEAKIAALESSIRSARNSLSEVSQTVNSIQRQLN